MYVLCKLSAPLLCISIIFQKHQMHGMYRKNILFNSAKPRKLLGIASSILNFGLFEPEEEKKKTPIFLVWGLVKIYCFPPLL